MKETAYEIKRLRKVFGLASRELRCSIFGRDDANYWKGGLDIHGRGQLIPNIILGKLPSPEDYFDDLVKRIPFMELYREDFYKICRGYRQKGPRCPLCAGNWFGYNVSNHKYANCPLARNPRHQQIFWMINTPACCNACAGRSLYHTHHFTSECQKCGGPHQTWMQVCDIDCRALSRNVEMRRLDHYSRVKELARKRKLGFWLVNDFPETRKRDYPGFPTFRDRYNNYKPIKSYHRPRYVGIEHGSARHPELKRIDFPAHEVAKWNRQLLQLLPQTHDHASEGNRHASNENRHASNRTRQASNGNRRAGRRGSWPSRDRNRPRHPRQHYNVIPRGSPVRPRSAASHRSEDRHGWNNEPSDSESGGYDSFDNASTASHGSSRSRSWSRSSDPESHVSN